MLVLFYLLSIESVKLFIDDLIAALEHFIA